MFTKADIDNAIASSELLIWREAFLDTPTWQQSIDHCHDRFHNEKFPSIAPSDPKDTIIHGVNIRENLYLLVAEATEQFFPQMSSVYDYINLIIDTPSFGSFNLINFVGGEESIGIHCDPRHSFYWQTKGSSTWKTWNKDPLDFDTGINTPPDRIEIINEGDLIFVPHGVWHSVDTPLPRTAMSFMYELPKDFVCDCHSLEELGQYQ